MKRAVSILFCAALLVMTLCSCGKPAESPLNTLKIGVGVGNYPQGDVFDNLTSRLAERGYVVAYTEFKTAREADEALAKGEIDMSCISDKTDFDDYNSKNPDVLLNLGGLYFYPYGIFLCDFEDKSGIADGAKILIPDDKEGMARALMLLEADGFITLKEGAGLNATLADIAENKRVFDIKAQPAESLAENIKTHGAGLVVMSSKAAVDAGYSVHKSACTIEGRACDAANQYSTLLLIKADTLTSKKISDIKTLLFSPLMYDLIDDFENDLIVPAFNLSVNH